jgi:hypothetical protein
MRVAAWLLAAVLTAGYTYVAHVALASLTATPALAAVRSGPLEAGDPRSASDPVWYGGRLDPVVVEAGRGGGGAMTTIVTVPRPTPPTRCAAPVAARWQAAS